MSDYCGWCVAGPVIWLDEVGSGAEAGVAGQEADKTWLESPSTQPPANPPHPHQSPNDQLGRNKLGPIDKS